MNVNKFGGGKFNRNNRVNYVKTKNAINNASRDTIEPIMDISDYINQNSVYGENTKLIKPIIDTSNISIDNNTRPIGSMRETIKPIMDIDDYFKLEKRDSFNFDRFKKDFGDTPIRDIENMFVNGTGDFKDFYNRNLYTPLSEASNIYSNTFDIASKYSTQRKEYEISQPNYDMEVGEYINRVDSPKDNFSYNNIYDSTDDIDNYYGMYGNVSSEIGVTPKPYEYQGKIKDLSINGTQSQNSDVKIDEGYDYTNIIDDDIDNYHSMYGQVSNELDVSVVGNGIVKGKYEDQMNRIQNDYYDSVRINGDDLNKNAYRMQDVESSNFTLNSDFSSENVKLNEGVVDNNITGYGTENYVDNWKNNNKNALFSDYLKSNSSDIDDLSKELNIDNLINRVESGEQLKQFELDDIDYAKKELSGMYNRSLERAKELGIDNIDDFDEIKRINDITESLNGNRKRNTEQTANVDTGTTINNNTTTVDTNSDNIINNVTEKTTENTNKTIDPKQEKISRMLDDDSYFQYDKSDDFYKDINILEKTEKTNKDKFSDGIKNETDNKKERFNLNEESKEKAKKERFNLEQETKTKTKTETKKERFKIEDLELEDEKITLEIPGEDGAKTIISGSRNKKNSNNFDYNTPTKDTINAKEYAKTVFGEDVTDAQIKQLVEGYAESDSGIKGQMYKEGFYYNKVNMKTSGANAESIGRVIADIKGDGMINEHGDFDIKSATGVVDKINGPFDQESVMKGFKSQAYSNRFQEAYDLKAKDLMIMSEDINSSYDDVSEIVKKIKNNGTLTPDEAKQFHRYQVKLKEYRDDVINWAEGLGYDAESVFGEGFKSKGKSKGKNNIKGTRDWSLNKTSINNINSHLGDLDYRVDLETGDYIRKSETVNNEILSDTLKTLTSDNDYNIATKNSKLNKDNYLDYLKDNEDALTTDNAKKLFKLKQNGVDIGEDAESVLQGLAISKEAGLKPDNTSLNKLNSAVDTLSSNNYMNITDENIDRIKSGDLIYENGKYKLRDLNLTENQRNSEAFKNILNSKNVGSENINDILDADKINNSIQSSNGAYKVTDEMIDKYKETVSKRFSSLKDGNDVTGYTIEEQLIQNKVDSKLAKEIAEAKKNGAENLSAYARNALYNMGELDETLVDFGKIKQDDLKKMINENKSLFGADNKDIDSMSETELRKMFGDTMNNTTSTGIKEGALASGFKFKVQGKDITDSKDFVSFYNSIIDTDKGDIAWKNLFGAMSMTEEGQVGFKDAYNWMMSGKKLSEFKQMKVAESVKEQVYKMLNESDKIDGLSTDDIAKMKATAKRIKETKAEDVYKYMNMDEISKNVGKLEKVEDVSKGMFSGLKGKGGTALKIAGAAGILAGIGGIGIMANNAAEERERKRQEMQQLMMAQNQSIRGGY